MNNQKKITDLGLPIEFIRLCDDYSIVTLIQASELITRLLEMSANIPNNLTINMLLTIQQTINENLDAKTREQLNLPFHEYRLDGYPVNNPVTSDKKDISSGKMDLDELFEKSERATDDLEKDNDDV